jgi:hypothetical protein
MGIVITNAARSPRIEDDGSMLYKWLVNYDGGSKTILQQTSSVAGELEEFAGDSFPGGEA